MTITTNIAESTQNILVKVGIRSGRPANNNSDNIHNKKAIKKRNRVFIWRRGTTNFVVTVSFEEIKNTYNDGRRRQRQSNDEN